MKKQLFIILGLVLLVAFTNVNAQSKFTLNVGPELALPMGSFGDVAGFGFGGSVGGELGLAENIKGFATVGYLMFGGKELFPGFETKYSGIPILVGAKYYIGKGGFYTLAETGFHLWSYDVPSINIFTGNVTTSSQSSTEFSYGVGAGYEFGAFDVNAKYIGAGSGISYIGVRVAYNFAL